MTTVLSNIIEHHARKTQRLASMEEDLAHAKLEEEKLKATIEALEKEKQDECKSGIDGEEDLYDLLEAKMEGFQIANHPRTIGGFENLNLTITKKWVEIPTLNLEEFEKCPVNFPDNDPNVQPLVTGLDADDFSVDKFFGLQDPISQDDVQASLDFEKELRTIEHNPARPVTLDLSVDAREDPSSPPPSQIVPVPTLVDLTRYASSPENEGSEDQGWPFPKGPHDPEAIFHVLKQVLYLIVPIDSALVMTGIMNVEQQQDGHSCGKHVLQMLACAARRSQTDWIDVLGGVA
ncbi:hypothetical protein R1flu_018123 [Riccia fluitans]|uniref:Uncharacterized protein n=1 Tax=Riccia fluitans TaxID=41844 RepID=A0ABD1ZEX9_9MARC